MDTHEGNANVTFGAFENDISIDSHEGTFTLTLPSGAGFDLATDFDDDAALDSDFDLSTLRITDDDDTLAPDKPGEPAGERRARGDVGLRVSFRRGR